MTLLNILEMYQIGLKVDAPKLTPKDHKMYNLSVIHSFIAISDCRSTENTKKGQGYVLISNCEKEISSFQYSTLAFSYFYPFFHLREDFLKGNILHINDHNQGFVGRDHREDVRDEDKNMNEDVRGRRGPGRRDVLRRPDYNEFKSK